MRILLLVLVLTQSVSASESNEYYRASQETQEYVVNLARFMGIRGRVEALISLDGQWGSAPEEGYVLIPAEADIVLKTRQLRLKSSSALHRGFLMHELGHVREKPKKKKSALCKLYLWSNGAERLRLSREEEQAADAAVLNDRDVLSALRDFFLQRSGVVSVSRLEELSENELSPQVWARSTHPSDASRALYFHKRLRDLEQRKI